jgi:hypothetical protein
MKASSESGLWAMLISWRMVLEVFMDWEFLQGGAFFC